MTLDACRLTVNAGPDEIRCSINDSQNRLRERTVTSDTGANRPESEGKMATRCRFRCPGDQRIGFPKPPSARFVLDE
jgi:hypothetical protein